MVTFGGPKARVVVLHEITSLQLQAYNYKFTITSLQLQAYS